MDLAAPTKITIPSRWAIDRLSHDDAVKEVSRLASILSHGAEALQGLYLRICDLLRTHELTDDEIQSVLSPHFPPPRVSEFLRIARAPDAVYIRYKFGFIGFRATLAACRGYHINSNSYLDRRKIRRAAERLVKLLGEGEVRVLGHRVIVSNN